MTKTTYRGTLVTKWQQLYPNQPFPDPVQHPDLYPDDFIMKTTNVTYEFGWWQQLTGDCCSYSRCCSKGLLDYECQFNNNCYLNIASLCIHMIGFFILFVALITALGYGLRAAYKFMKGVVFVNKFIKFVSKCVECMTLGVFKEKVYRPTKKKKAKLTDDEIRIRDKMNDELGMGVLLYRLDDHQKKRILEVMEDYEIVGDSSSSGGLNNCAWLRGDGCCQRNK